MENMLCSSTDNRLALFGPVGSMEFSRQYLQRKVRINKMKRICSVLASILLMFGVYTVASANVNVVVNGSKVNFTESDGVPFAENGRTLVPLRATAEAYGAVVDYDSSAREAVLDKDGITVRVPIGESFIYRNGERINNDAPARVINSRTYLPIRVVMESFGATVGWDGATSTVTVEDEDFIFITGFEKGKKVGGNFWLTWNKAIELQSNGNYREAIEKYRSVGPDFIGEGPVNSAILFQHLGECYSRLGEYHHASLCFYRSSYYWAQDPSQDQTALYFSNLAESVESKLQLYLKTDDPAYNRTTYFGAPNEPENGILLGAYAENDPGASNPHGELYFTGFPRLTGREHGIYLLYLPYGADISGYESHFDEAAKRNVIIELGLQPSGGLDQVQADSYLINLAKYMEDSKCRFILRFANEMNESSSPWYTTDYNKYIEKFRTVANVFREYAPSVGLVWAPNFFPQDNIDFYYPGDEYVDYVGLSIYKEYSTDNDPLGEDEDRGSWINILDGVYERYGNRKPIIIAECGCNYHSIATGADITDFASEQMLEYYTYLPIKYPNLKMVVLYDSNESNSSAGFYARKFQLSDNYTLLNAYKQGINSSERYLERWDDESADEYYYELFPNAIVPAGTVEFCSFISTPSKKFSGVTYLINGAEAGTAYSMPYTVSLDLSSYSGQTVEIKAVTTDGSVEAVIKVQVE